MVMNPSTNLYILIGSLVLGESAISVLILVLNFLTGVGV